MRRRRLLLAGLALGLPRRTLAEDGVPDLVGRLARERSYAEDGVGQLKRWVKRPSALLKGQQLYGDAKGAADDAIAHLLAALAAPGQPDQDPQLRQKLDTLAEKRLAFSRYAKDALEPVAPQGTKAGVADALAEAAGGIVEGLMKGAVAVWEAWRKPDEDRRETLRHQVEGEKWRSFGEVPAA